METQLLREQEIFPEEEVLKHALNRGYPIYETLINTITSPEYGLTCEWNYYKDSKSWLCKISNKKKTVFWLSIWDGYFQIGFYFTEKHLEGIAALDIDEKIKEDFCKMKPIGRLLPMIFKISQKKQLSDLLKVIIFKKMLK